MTLNDTQKKYVLAGMSVAGLAAILGFLWNQGAFATVIPSGTVSDVQQPAGTPDMGGGLLAPGKSGGYTGGNMPPLVPVPLPAEQALENAAPAGQGACCGGGKSSSCFSGSPLDTGDTYSSVSALLDYYKSTNPYYQQLLQEQTQNYATLFVSGSGYSSGAGLG